MHGISNGMQRKLRCALKVFWVTIISLFFASYSLIMYDFNYFDFNVVSNLGLRLGDGGLAAGLCQAAGAVVLDAPLIHARQHCVGLVDDHDGALSWRVSARDAGGQGRLSNDVEVLVGDDDGDLQQAH